MNIQSFWEALGQQVAALVPANHPAMVMVATASPDTREEIYAFHRQGASAAVIANTIVFDFMAHPPTAEEVIAAAMCLATPVDSVPLTPAEQEIIDQITVMLGDEDRFRNMDMDDDLREPVRALIESTWPEITARCIEAAREVLVNARKHKGE